MVQVLLSIGVNLLSTEILGLRLKNPTILASGIMGTTGESLKKAALCGAGAVVTKSAGLEPRAGHNNPTVLETDFGLINAVGLSNPGLVAVGEEMKVARDGGVPVIASIYGFSMEEYATGARTLEGLGAQALELNLSCPNVEKAGDFFGQDPDMAREAVKAVKKVTRIQVSAKLSPNVNDIGEIAAACQRGGCDAITAINTVKGMAIDIRAKRPILANRVGGYSGRSIKPIGVRAVYDIFQEVDIPIIGCGGIVCGEDAVEYIMAGARAVQIGTGVLDRGLDVFDKVAREIRDFMEENGYSSMDEMVGAAQG